MKNLLLPLLAVSLSAASAQTVINGVVISHPGEAKRTQIRVVPATAQRSAPTSATRTVPAFADEAVPADWVDIRGRVSLGDRRAALPSGSKVTVRLLNAQNVTLIGVDFSPRTLPASYQLVANPSRFSAGSHYFVQATVTGSAGQTLYESALYSINPSAKRILADLTVR